MAIAQGEIGQARIVGPANNARIIEYHSATAGQANNDETTWCSAFVNWCLLQVGIVGTNDAWAASWQHWGDSTEPRYGAITLIHSPAIASTGASGNHVSFLTEVTAEHYKLFGGNQSDRVKLSSYAKSNWHLVTYRWPKS